MWTLKIPILQPFGEISTVIEIIFKNIEHEIS